MIVLIPSGSTNPTGVNSIYNPSPLAPLPRREKGEGNWFSLLRGEVNHSLFEPPSAGWTNTLIEYREVFVLLEDATMHRLFAATLVSAALIGCAGQSGSVQKSAVSTQLAEGVELVVLKLPAMV
jgi:hypothetical protein